MAQDSAGFWWFGTQDGLNRYDGYEFETFKHEPFDTTSLADNQVPALLCDKQNRLWVGFGFHGLDLFLPDQNTFKHFTKENTGLSSNQITCLAESKSGAIWVGTTFGLNMLELKNGACRVTQYFLRDSLEKSPQFIRSVFEDKKGQVYVGTWKGLAMLDAKTKRLVQIPIAPKLTLNPNQEEALGVVSIASDRKENLWLGTAEGLFLWNQTTNSWAKYWNNFKNEFKDFFFTDIRCAPNGDLWVSTMSGGVFMLPWKPDLEDYHDVWYHFSRRDGVRLHLKSDEIRTLKPDALNPNVVWLGHATAGVEKLVRRNAVFSSFDLQHGNLKNLGTRFISDLVTDTMGGLWVGTNKGLVYQRDLAFKVIDSEQLPGEGGYIAGLTRDPNGRIWLATLRGMGELIPDKQGGIQLKTCFTNSTAERIHTIASDAKGYIYFALGPRLFIYNPKKDALQGPIQLPDTINAKGGGLQVYSILHDSQNRLWLGTTKGIIMWPDIIDPMENLERLPYRIFCHNPQKRTSLRNEIILCMKEDQYGNIWLGSGNGLHKVREVGDDIYFEAFTEKNGLANNFIYGILEDPERGHLWLSTNNGLSRFSPRSGLAENYDAGDGLQSNEFNSHAFYRDPATSEMFFGGINGFTRFFPAEIHKDSIPPKVSITGLSLPQGDRKPLLGVTEDASIELSYRNNSFAVHFIGINYTQPERNQYKYKLRGLSDTWIHCGPTRQVNFSNLSPGEYTFEVTSSNSDGVWNKQSDSLEILIKPPFHRTLWFYLLLALGLGLILLGAHRLRVREKVRRVLEMERVRENAAADFHDELGHKLTVIALSGEIAKQKLVDKPEVKPQLDKIIANAHSLYYAMKDLLWVLDPTKDSVYDLALLLKDFGDELFDRTGVAFQAIGLQPDAMQNHQLAMDQKRHVALMFKEAMNNSLKHAGGTEACLSMKLDGDNLRVAFSDNGKGFDASELPNSGNGLLNMRTRSETIGADFGIESNGKGTEVWVELEV